MKRRPRFDDVMTGSPPPFSIEAFQHGRVDRHGDELDRERQPRRPEDRKLKQKERGGAQADQHEQKPKPVVQRLVDIGRGLGSQLAQPFYPGTIRHTTGSRSSAARSSGESVVLTVPVAGAAGRRGSDAEPSDPDAPEVVRAAFLSGRDVGI